MKKFFISSRLWYCIISIVPTYLSASSYGPSLIFHKPSSTIPYLGQFNMSFTYGQTNQGYNRHGKIVPFLQEYGNEDLLEKFIDSTEPTSIKKLGEVNFNGTLHFERLNLNYCKNIHHDLFIGIGTVIQNLTVADITTSIDLNQTLNPTQEKGLERFLSNIPKQINSAGMYTTSLSFGYNKMFTDLESLEFIHLYLAGHIATPQSLSSNYLSLLQYPLAGNIAFSYPITAIVVLGISSYLDFGVYASIIPFQKTQTFGLVNNELTHNDILLGQLTQIEVQPKPIFTGTWYLETHNLKKNLTLTLGYGATYGMQWHIKPIDTAHFSESMINKTETLDAFYIASMFFKIDYSFASSEKPHCPLVSLYYVLPIAGSYFPKINTIGGSYALGFSWGW